MSDYSVRASAPFYVLRASIPCWKCREPTPVVGLVATLVEADGESHGDPTARPVEPVSLRNITDLPYDLLQVMRAYQPRYVKRESRTAGMSYYQNECWHCGVNIGDSYLFSEPGGPFFPDTPADASSVEVLDVPVIGSLEINADWGQGGVDLIFERRAK